MPQPLIDLTGKRFGRLLVIERATARGAHEARWLCRCDCGVEKEISGSALRNGHASSCRCLHREVMAKLGAVRRTKGERSCRNCGKAFSPRLKEGGKRFAGRDTCSKSCGSGRGQARPERRRDFGELIQTKSIPEPMSGCWIWLGTLSKEGYPQSGVRGEHFAHRVSHRHFKGPIPAGFHVDHKCFTPSCVNPDHLEAVTPTENLKRSHRRRRRLRARR